MCRVVFSKRLRVDSFLMVLLHFSSVAMGIPFQLDGKKIVSYNVRVSEMNKYTLNYLVNVNVRNDYVVVGVVVVVVVSMKERKGRIVIVFVAMQKIRARVGQRNIYHETQKPERQNWSQTRTHYYRNRFTQNITTLTH